jgi:hypothetical protein
MRESISRSKRIFTRTPGERAFDRCLFPFAVSFVVSFVLGVIGGPWLRSPSRPASELALTTPSQFPLPIPSWHLWLYFALGLVGALLWLRALLTLIGAWRDPSAKIQRFACCFLLIPFASIVYILLSAPFR